MTNLPKLSDMILAIDQEEVGKLSVNVNDTHNTGTILNKTIQYYNKITYSKIFCKICNYIN